MFGWVTSVTTFATEDEAVRLANASAYGLAPSSAADTSTASAHGGTDRVRNGGLQRRPLLWHQAIRPRP
ncbi:aldehyde dehydrogenase family protein [Arthrobacter sp. SLBN-100]|uniref:aldehyde dehydrogenase family protein n=1 Tax=Arthrobacter sp. SLBN-100 TaxID=2768450 RepID=UPI001F379E56|nr:aldehyde dehydrogenase family protein [Arthrobacter sp. SLBN-100]